MKTIESIRRLRATATALEEKARAQPTKHERYSVLLDFGVASRELESAVHAALPALIEVAEAAKEVQRAKAEWHRRRPFYSTAEAHSRVTMAEHYLAEALAKLEAP